MVQPARFTRDPELTEVYWRVREGLHGLLGKLRPRGTSLMIEDVCVAPERIAEAAADIRELLARHGFLPGVAGHASAGNLHFMLTPTFTDPADRDRYEAFMGDLVDLIVDKYDGSLKAEHGTGLNMAPYVEREWGAKATEMMWRIKALADPAGVLAPGVLLNRDPGVHLRNLKSTPPIEEVADTCVECGFCEPVCPSRHLTTTPRQRIVLRREMARQAPGSPVAACAARRVRVRRARDVRGGRHVHARLPARNRHRQAREGAARAPAHGPRGAGRPRCSPGAGRGSSAARARPARRSAAARRDAHCCGQRSATSWCPPGGRDMPRPRAAAAGHARARARRPCICRHA